ncbi:MAG: hypothetical protein ACYCXB_00710 [Candidatus Humimicrobiaceae bacterium]
MFWNSCIVIIFLEEAMVDNDQDKSTYRLVASVSKTMGDSLP